MHSIRLLFSSLAVTGLLAGCDSPLPATKHAARVATERAQAKPEAEGPEAKSLAERVPPEERAFLLEFDTDGEFYRMFEAGDRVDLMAVFDRDEKHAEAAEKIDDCEACGESQSSQGATTLLQNVLVLERYEHPRVGSQGAVLALSLTNDEINVLGIVEDIWHIEALLRATGNSRISRVLTRSLPESLDERAVRGRERLERLCRGAAGEDLEEECGHRRSASEPVARPESGSLADRLFETERAQWLDVQLPAGVIQPGDRVDLFATFPSDSSSDGGEDAEAGSSSSSLIYNVEVIETAGTEQIDGLVVGVSRQEALLVALSDRLGEPYVGLRGSGDAAMGSPKDRSHRDILEDLEVINRPRGPKPHRPWPSDSSAEDGPVILRGSAR